MYDVDPLDWEQLRSKAVHMISMDETGGDVGGDALPYGLYRMNEAGGGFMLNQFELLEGKSPALFKIEFLSPSCRRGYGERSWCVTYNGITEDMFDDPKAAGQYVLDQLPISVNHVCFFNVDVEVDRVIPRYLHRSLEDMLYLTDHKHIDQNDSLSIGNPDWWIGGEDLWRAVHVNFIYRVMRYATSWATYERRHEAELQQLGQHYPLEQVDDLG